MTLEALSPLGGYNNGGCGSPCLKCPFLLIEGEHTTLLGFICLANSLIYYDHYIFLTSTGDSLCDSLINYLTNYLLVIPSAASILNKQNPHLPHTIHSGTLYI